MYQITKSKMGNDTHLTLYFNTQYALIATYSPGFIDKA